MTFYNFAHIVTSLETSMGIWNYPIGKIDLVRNFKWSIFVVNFIMILYYSRIDMYHTQVLYIFTFFNHYMYYTFSKLLKSMYNLLKFMYYKNPNGNNWYCFPNSWQWKCLFLLASNSGFEHSTFLEMLYDNVPLSL